MIPKIRFRYSRVYDDRYRISKDINKKLAKQNKKYPSQKKIRNYILKIESDWRRIEGKIFMEISKISGLKWNEKEIKCYIIGYGRPFSDPLTLRLYKNKNDFIDTLTHELIHQIQIQNWKNIKVWWEYICRKYKKESILTKKHILLHAIHTEIYLKIFNMKRLNKNIMKNKDYLDYKRSWEIVQKEGYKNIINEFRKRLR